MIPVTVCLFDRYTIGVSMTFLIVKQTGLKSQYDLFSYKICMEIWMLLFNELNLELMYYSNGGWKWLLFFLSGLRPCQELFTLVNGFEEEQSGGA